MALRPTAAWLNTLALLELELELDSAALNGLVTLFAPLDVDLAGNNAGDVTLRRPAAPRDGVRLDNAV